MLELVHFWEGTVAQGSACSCALPKVLPVQELVAAAGWR